MKKILVFFGMIASGKSYLAATFAARRQLAYFNTDRVRKELAGVSPTTKCAAGLNQGIYGKEFTRRTYQTMLDQAAERLSAGDREVVLDGSYSSRIERDYVQSLAVSLGAKAIFIYCHCPAEVVKSRLAERARDPEAVSDADWKIYEAQQRSFQMPAEIPARDLLSLDTNNHLENILKILESHLATLS